MNHSAAMLNSSGHAAAHAPSRSFSAMGRSCDLNLLGSGSDAAAGQSRNAAEVTAQIDTGASRKTISLRPWDGVDLVEAVLAEAHRESRAERERVVASSPRINPRLIERDLVEDTEEKAQRFMLAVARDVPQSAAAPAVVAAELSYSAAIGRARTPAAAAAAATDDDDDENRVSRGPAKVRPATVVGVTRKAAATAAQNRPPTRRPLTAKFTFKAASTGLAALIALRESTGLSTSQQSLHSSACFSAPPRDRPDNRRVPAVGQYNPRVDYTLRRSASPALSKAPRPGLAADAEREAARALREARPASSAGTHYSGPGSPASYGSGQWPKGDAGDANASPASGTLKNTLSNLTSFPSGTNLNATMQEGGDEATKTKAKGPAAGTSSFLSTARRFSADDHATAAADVAPVWPIPTPGARPTTAGAFSPLPRKMVFDTMHMPSTISFVEKRPHVEKCLVDMRGSTSRESHKGQKHLYGGEPHPDRPSSGLTAAGLTTVLSTARRPPSPVVFEHMSARTTTPAAPDRPVLADFPLEQPRGFVDLRRMVYGGERTLLGDPANQAPTREPLSPTFDLVMRRAPSPAFPKAATPSAFADAPDRAGTRSVSPGGLPPRPHSSTPGLQPRPSKGGAAGSRLTRATSPVVTEAAIKDYDDGIFNPSDESVRRRAPIVCMGGTSRDAPIMRASRDATPSTVYDVNLPQRVSTPDIGNVLSRPKRDLRYKAHGAVDVVYNLPQPKVKGGALSFSKYKGRQ
jgi:hypothetical protein